MDMGSSIYDVHKKLPIFSQSPPPPTPHHPQKVTIDLLCRNNIIHKHVTNFKTPSPRSCVDVINVWSLYFYHKPTAAQRCLLYFSSQPKQCLKNFKIFPL